MDARRAAALLAPRLPPAARAGVRRLLGELEADSARLPVHRAGFELSEKERDPARARLLALHFYPPETSVREVRRGEREVRVPRLLECGLRAGELLGGTADRRVLSRFLGLARGTPWPAQLALDVEAPGRWRFSAYLSCVDREHRSRRDGARLLLEAARRLGLARDRLPRLDPDEALDVLAVTLTPDGGAALKIYTVVPSAAVRAAARGRSGGARALRAALERWPLHEAGFLYRVGGRRPVRKAWARFVPPRPPRELAGLLAEDGGTARWLRGVARRAGRARAGVSYLTLEAGGLGVYYR